MIDIQTISILIAAASVVIGVSDFILSSRYAREERRRELETRQAQLFMQIFDSFHQPEFFNKYTNFLTWHWDDYKDFMERYGPKNPKAWYGMGSIAAFFEGIGVLVHQKLIDVDLVAQLMARHILFFWERIRPISEGMRKQFKMPEVDIWLEYLYNEIKPIAEKQRLELRMQGRG